MGARHGTTISNKIQLVGEDSVGLSRNQTKIQVVQSPAGPNLHQVGGRGVSGIGTVYPVNPAVDDRGTVADANIDVVMASPLHHYTKMSLNNANPTINLIDMIVGLSSTFTLDLTNTIALSSLTFSPALINAPTLDLGIGQRNVLYIVGHRTASELRYEVINGTGGGGVSFPIIPPVDVRGNVNTAQDIDLALTTAHSTTMTLTGDIAITFSNFPATANQLEWEIEIKQDATGEHDVTSWPAAVTPIPVINQTALATTLVVLRTNDNGTTIFTILASSGVISSVSLWANFTAVNNINAGNFDILAVKNLDFDNATSRIKGLKTLEFFDDAPNKNIASAADEISYNTPALDQHSFYAGGIEILRIVENVASVYRLDMLDHSIDNAQDLRLDDASGAIVFAGTDPAIGYDSVAARFILNMPTGGNLFITNNNVIGTTQINNNSVAANVINANDSLQLGVDGTAPTVAGEFRNDGTDVFVFSGSAVRNLSNVDVVQTSIADGNTSATVLDSAPSFTVVLNGVQKYSIANTRVDYEELDLFGLTSINMNDSAANLISTLTASATGLVLNIASTADVYDLQFNTVDAFHVDNTKTLITSTTPNTTAALLQLFRDDASPTVNDKIGEIQFRGRDLNAANVAYGKMHVETEIVIAATAQASFHWILRNNGGDTDQMNLKDGVLAVSRHLPVAAASGAALVLNRVDSGAAIGDEAGEISFNISDPTERNLAVINVVWDDTQVGDDSSRFDFKLLTDDNLQNILTLRGSPITDNKISIEIGADSLIFAKTGVIGYFVTSDPTITSSIGNSGTMQIPQFSDGSPSLADLNAAFGAFDGAIGQDINDGKLYVRKSATVWSFYSESGTVV